MNYNYTMEELLPVVAKLAEKYNGYESTSMTYERAEQLMEAVLYCVRKMEIPDGNSIIGKERISARQAYEIGYEGVIRKVRLALDMYNNVSQGFTGYGNHCLYDTVVKEIPEFFKWYDAEFAPQITILTLDYPVLKDLSAYSGIDKIYEFISCIRIEKLFLEQFSKDDIIDILCKYNSQYQDMIENICEVVYMDVICHVLAKKPLAERNFSKADYKEIQMILFQTDREHLKYQLTAATKVFVETYYEDNNDLLEYLTLSIGDIIIRLKSLLDVK